jgi:hypothetical protein
MSLNERAIYLWTCLSNDCIRIEKGQGNDSRVLLFILGDKSKKNCHKNEREY